MEATLEALTRTDFGKNEARRIRRNGRVPGVLYGEGKDATPISVEPRELLRILHSESGANTLISLKLTGTDSRVLVKDFQLDPVTPGPPHFYRVAMDKMLEVTVQVTVKGEAKGVKQQSGILEFIRREIVVSCLPSDIPEHIEVDVSELMLHQGIRVRDIPASPKWKAVTEGEAMLVHVIMPKVEEAPAPAEGVVATAAVAATPAEPEVIKKGKKEDEADAKAEKKK
jgi:large subunit ribosomal protein L25